MGISCYFQLHGYRREQGNKRKLLLSKGEGRQCATLSMGLHFSTAVLKNPGFAVELWRPRRWKSEVLSII